MENADELLRMASDVVNRWYWDDFFTRRRRRPDTRRLNLVEYDSWEGIGELTWHGGAAT